MFGIWKLVGKIVGLGLLAVLVVGGILTAGVTVPYFGNTAVIVRSDSMEPALKAGDLVVARPRAEGYEVGEILVYTSPNNEGLIITHRVVDRSPTTSGFEYVTQGDMNEEEDPYRVQEKDVRGRQILVVPYVGKMLAFGKTKPGFIGFVVVPVLLIVIGDGLYVWSEIRKRRKARVEARRQAMRSRKKKKHTNPQVVPEMKRKKLEPVRIYRRRKKTKMDSLD